MSKLSKRKFMTTWASWITTYRYNRLDRDVVKAIEAALGHSIKDTQVGVVVGKLRNAGEFDLIEELTQAIDHYNEYMVVPWNAYVQWADEVMTSIRHLRKDSAYDHAWSMAFPYGLRAAYDEFERDSYRAADVFKYEYSSAK